MLVTLHFTLTFFQHTNLMSINSFIPPSVFNSKLCCRERGSELFLREKESCSGLSIDFVKELAQVVESSIGLRPTYIFTRITDLPQRERSFFLNTEVQKYPQNHLSSVSVFS